MVDRSSKSGYLSPQASKTFSSQRNSLQPFRLNMNNQNGIRIVESGELRVVNKAAKNHWDFSKDNSKQLKQHLHDLRFAK